MKSNKVKTFLELAGCPTNINDKKTRELAAQLLLSETLEYVIKGLGVIPKFGSTEITKPDGLSYAANDTPIDRFELLDGLSDVAYTMYWNALVYNQKLDEAFDLVCDNNLEKFVLLKEWSGFEGELQKEAWTLNKNILWPESVVSVNVKKVSGNFYAVGKDQSGKVRKPSSYKSVDLSSLID